MANHTYNGTNYPIKRNANGRYILVTIEDITSPVTLDMGTWSGRTTATHNGAINPATWSIKLAGGRSYIESRGARVRVWI